MFAHQNVDLPCRNMNNSTWSQWLFFQNATQVHLQWILHGGKTPIVLYQEMKLQFEPHVSIEPAACCSFLATTGQVPLPEHETLLKNTCTCTIVPSESFVFRKGDLTS